MDAASPEIRKRKRATRQQRLTPCVWCDHPLSQRHHLFEFHEYGESDVTIQLCANCHEFYHIFYAALEDKHGRLNAIRLATHIVMKLGNDDRRVKEAFHAVNKMKALAERFPDEH